MKFVSCVSASFILFFSSLFAPVATPSSYFITFSTTQFGQVTVLVPSNYAADITFSDSSPYFVNNNSSTLTLSVLTPSTIYNDTLQLPPFSAPTYRTATSATRIDLNVTGLVDSNLPLYGASSDASPGRGVSDVVLPCLLLLGGFAVFLMIYRRH